MRRRPQSTLQLPNFPSVESRVSESTEIWARDLRSLFEHAKDRFGDVSWESEEVEDADRIWGHKGGFQCGIKLMGSRHLRSSP